MAVVKGYEIYIGSSVKAQNEDATVINYGWDNTGFYYIEGLWSGTLAELKIAGSKINGNIETITDNNTTKASGSVYSIAGLATTKHIINITLVATTYEHILNNGHKVQVDSAIRDENGLRISTGYAKKTELNNKQDTLTAGQGITIVNNVISSTGGGVQIVDSLPTPTETIYNEAKLYLNGNDLYYCGKTEVVEPIVSTVASLPSGRRYTSAVAIGTNAYIFGGYINDVTNQILKYDSISNTCTTLSATLPSARSETSAVSIGTNAYIFGGRTSQILKYDTISNTCTTLSATTLKNSYDTSAVAIGTNAYIFGGYDDGYRTYKILKFDSGNNTCVQISSMPIKTCLSSAVAIGTNAYIFGGENGNKIDTILKFDSISNTCTTLSATLPSVRKGTSAVAIGTNAYIFGGFGTAYLNEIIKYDTISNTCTTLSATLPSARSETSAVSIGTNAYIFGGETINSVNSSNIVKVAFGFTYLFNKLAIGQ